MDVTVLSDVRITLLVQGYCRDVGDLYLKDTQGQSGLCVDLLGLPAQLRSSPADLMYIKTLLIQFNNISGWNRGAPP